MESIDFLLKFVTVVTAIVSSYVTTKVTLSFVLKELDKLNRQNDLIDKSIIDTKLQLGKMLPREVAYSSFVTKEELKLHLDNVVLQLEKGGLQQSQILEKLKELSDEIKKDKKC